MNSAVTAYCHNCGATSSISPQAATECLHCPRCGSDFMECLSPGRTGSLFRGGQGPSFFRADTQRGGGRPLEHELDVLPYDGNVSTRVLPGSANAFVQEISQMLESQSFHGRTFRSSFPRRNMAIEMEHLIGQLAEYSQPARTPVSTDCIRSLRRERLRTGCGTTLVGQPCAVCLDPFKDGDMVVHIPCQHVFHEGCVLPWFEEHNTCPVCRHVLPTESASSITAGAPQSSTRRNQVAQEPNHHHHTHRDVHNRDQISESFLDLSRRATGGENSHSGRMRSHTSQRRPDESQMRQSTTESERWLAESLRVAQNQLSSFEDRLTQHVTEQRRIQNQIVRLQEHRQSIREQLASANRQNSEAVTRMESIVRQHHHTQQNLPRGTNHHPSFSRWFTGMIRYRPHGSGRLHD